MQGFIHQHTFPEFYPCIKPHPSQLLKKVGRESGEVLVQSHSGSSLLKFYYFVNEFITAVTPYGAAVVQMWENVYASKYSFLVGISRNIFMRPSKNNKELHFLIVLST